MILLKDTHIHTHTQRTCTKNLKECLEFSVRYEYLQEIKFLTVNAQMIALFSLIISQSNIEDNLN